jgi:hypothetical protein
MADQLRQDSKEIGRHKNRSGEPGETFKREGPTPAANDSGGTVDEMNRAAEESVIRNVTPDEQTD